MVSVSAVVGTSLLIVLPRDPDVIVLEKYATMLSPAFPIYADCLTFAIALSELAIAPIIRVLRGT